MTLEATKHGLQASHGHVRDMAVVQSRVQVGMHAVPIKVEVHLSNGLPAFHLIGLPEKGVRESKERVRSAILNAGFRFPDRRITINLAPAHLPKPDSHLDLAMALGILLASSQLSADTDAYEFYGELALSGELRPIRSIVAAAVGCQAASRVMIASHPDAVIAAQVKALLVKAAGSLLEVCRYLQDDLELPAVSSHQANGQPCRKHKSHAIDWCHVRGQALAKRALMLACAGGHNVVLRGAPGTGKTLLAHGVASMLPDLQSAEKIDVMLVHAMRGDTALPTQRPFRQPHHSASYAAMVGGGQPLMPGEVSMAHHGVLFLDEWPEFKPSVLNSLREPLESGCVHLARAGQAQTWPAAFMLVATCNPCPCGYMGQPKCQCTPSHIQRYQQRISGPLWDRIDIMVDMQPNDGLCAEPKEVNATSAMIQQQVQACYQRQWQRQQCCNAKLPDAMLMANHLQPGVASLLQQASVRFSLSMRASQRVVKVARTIADWSSSESIEVSHMHEALGFRCDFDVV
jgi:magnesium chelatase family protein